jgi:general secretion pathway protein D
VAPVQKRLLPALLAAALSSPLAVAAPTPRPASTAATPAAAPAQVTLNFQDTDIDAVARAMGAIVNRPVLVDPRVKGKLTLFANDPVTPAQAWALFTGSLRGLGYAVVESAGLRKVVPETEARLLASAAPSGAPAGATAGSPQGDSIVTQVITLVHENAANLVAVLRPLISPNNTINVNAGNNTLVITDYASNLARLRTLIAALDTPNATDVEVIPLQHSQATTLAATVQKLLDGGGSAATAASPSTTAGASTGGSGGAAAVVLADPALNALLVRAPNPARLAMVRALVARLDQPGSASSRVHVVYLQHAESTRLAAVLRAAFPAPSGGIASTSGTLTGAPATPSTGGSSRSGGSTEASTPVSATAAPSTGGYIQADPASNALIITAPEPLWRDLRQVIDQLDQRRAQLYVESLVAEVDASRSRDIGVKWPQILGISASTLSTVTLGDIASALESQAGSTILSNANVVTLDNEEAKIVVGQNVPFVTGSYTTSTASNPFQTIDRKDVGITLRIRPQISADGQIRMTIFQESSSVASTSSASGPTTNTRSIQTTVVVGDGKILALGGLIEDSLSASNDEMPVISKIPVLGALFRAESRSRKKTNLVVFLRPRVMADEAAASHLSINRYDVLRAEQRALPADPHLILQDAPRPELPAEATNRP